MFRWFPLASITFFQWQKGPTATKQPPPLDKHASRRPGKLHCIVGPMFSMKTTLMLQRLSQFADVTHTRALVINHDIDRNRKVGNNLSHLGLSSHSSQFFGISPLIDTCYASDLSKVDVSKYLIIGIDEVCFFSNLEPTLKKWVDQGKHIYCAGLDGNFLGEPFEEVARLVALSDTFQKVTAVCQSCTDESPFTSPDFFVPAPFTSKIDGNLTSAAVEQGGKDKYRPSCRYHHQQNKTVVEMKQ